MVATHAGDLSSLTLSPSAHSPPAKPPIATLPPRLMPPLPPPSPPPPLPVPPVLPFAVGLALAEEDLGDRTADVLSPGSTPPFVRGIMHRAVNPRCFVATVHYDAPSSVIAARLAVPADDVDFVWLSGVRDPVVAPCVPIAPAPRYAPLRAVAVPASRALRREHKEEAVAEAVLWGRQLDRRQFADLFAAEKQVDEDVLEFGNALIGKLAALIGSKEGFPRYRGLGRRRHVVGTHQEKLIMCDSNSSSSAGMVDSGSCSAGTERRCGFSVKGSHVDVDVLCEGLAICKTGGGLYRTARSTSAIGGGRRREVYFEVVVVEDNGSGGICVGVATEELALNKLVGSNEQSFGLHSSGQVVSHGGEFADFGRAFKRGDRVGCLVSVGGQEGRCGEDGDVVMGEAEAEAAPPVEIAYWVNGEFQGKSCKRLWENVPRERRRLYAAVSLYKKGSKAVLQCCQSEWATPLDSIRGKGRKPEAICSCRSERSSGSLSQ